MKALKNPFIGKCLYLYSMLMVLGLSCQDVTQEENLELKQEIKMLGQEIQFIRKENARLKELLGEPLEIGFEVQIAAFQEFNLEVYLDELVRFQEDKEFGYKRYVLGQFSRYEDAEAFLKDVHRMGVRDAFIAGIVDGERSSIEEAQEAANAYYGDLSESNYGWDDP